MDNGKVKSRINPFQPTVSLRQLCRRLLAERSPCSKHMGVLRLRPGCLFDCVKEGLQTRKNASRDLRGSFTRNTACHGMNHTESLVAEFGSAF